MSLKVVALQGSPNVDGLTASLAQAALDGAAEAGAEGTLIQLTAHQIAHCRQCDNGWGICREQGRCALEDDFAAVRAQVLEADAWMLVTPVYFGDLSECVKAFTDRLRRCNVGAQGAGLAEKSVIGVAAAGGSGRGTATCLGSLDRLFAHINADIADLIVVTRRSAAYKREAVRAAARTMVEGIEA